MALAEVTNLGEDFASNPLNYVEETDLVIDLVHRLNDRFGKVQVSLQNPVEESVGYKEGLIDNSPLSDNGSIERAHAEVEITDIDDLEYKRNKRFDVVLLEENIETPITWSSGSKKFRHEMVEAAFELKFVKNKPKFPTNPPVSEFEVRDGQILYDGKKKLLDLKANKLKEDIENLGFLDEHGIDSYFLLFSNFDYLYQDSQYDDLEYNDPEEEKLCKYSLLGEKAYDHLDSIAGENHVNFQYGYPSTED